MKWLSELTKGQITVVVIEIAVILVLLILLIVRSKKNKKTKEHSQAVQSQMREEKLNRMLQNPHTEENGSGKLHPVEEHYTEKKAESTQENVKRGIGLELTVRTELSEKKYITTLEKELSIGRAPHNNLVIDHKKVSSVHCILINHNGLPYVMDMGSTNHTYLERNHKKKQVGKKPVLLKAKDRLLLGDIIVDIVVT